ncbi:membrane-associated protease RseP (regulator of RpoE activity) [Lipingzhangella halophila]|uniref:Membrane-associated protease RseP (Regulator of RpoE activity) n=1 Tax=Lipingzhangella halophila TaxID=1783352 RepID=A0A7W7RK87_9ACTN|nr:site-2 protease family protein [Lipingzhangella halophila]MBB4933485.1 membrane-associated protease RseP (regulator of RpoE activity) [Lipingzhangella halophila]
MVALLTTLGIVLLFLGLLLSFAWHELGHLATAKMFGVRCTEYMVGFGKTLWSTRRGETEYGIKLVPLGGFVRMVGMAPPGKQDTSGKPPSRWRAMIEDARDAYNAEQRPGDEGRLFYTRAPWKRVIVMAAGPVMNLILAALLFSTVLMGLGVHEETNEVGTVSECLVSVEEATGECPEDAEPTPAAAAGVQPGDRIVAVAGTATPDWQAANKEIREHTGPTEMKVERDGETVTLEPDLVQNELPARDADGEIIYQTDERGRDVYDDEGRPVPETETVGFLGITFATERQTMTAMETAGYMGDSLVLVGEAIVSLPSKVPDLFGAAFLGEDRRADSPIGVVGVSRIGGEVLSQPLPVVDRAVIMLTMLGSVNLFLFAFNMLPLLPLDGGHIFGAIWESLRRKAARLFRRPDPGPFDVVKLMPLAYVVMLAFILFSLIVLVADIVNPVRLLG